MELVME